jgi:4-hydroxyphenylacetate 3-monooxygenase
MPNQSLLYTGRVLASSQLNPMMRVCRELCGGQICVTPDFAAFQDPETAPWLEKYYTINEDWRSEDRRRRLAFARPAQLQLRRSPADLPALRAIAAFLPTSPRFTGNFDWDAPLRFVHKSAGLSDRVLADIGALRSRTTGAWHKS